MISYNNLCARRFFILELFTPIIIVQHITIFLFSIKQDIINQIPIKMFHYCLLL